MHSVAIELVREVKYRTVHVLVHVCFISQPRNRGSSYFIHCSIRIFLEEILPSPPHPNSSLFFLSSFHSGIMWWQIPLFLALVWGGQVSHLVWPSPTELPFAIYLHHLLPINLFLTLSYLLFKPSVRISRAFNWFLMKPTLWNQYWFLCGLVESIRKILVAWMDARCIDIETK